jgi:pimeloyl-ACP methyl ester carboxylesterase
VHTQLTADSARRRNLPALALLALALSLFIIPSCASTASTTPSPKGLPSFYSEPDPLPRGPAGTLVKEQRIATPQVHGSTFRVMYLSENLHNQIVPVTGTIYIPKTPPPQGGYPVVTWGHGTNGMAEQCTPSLDPSQAVPLLNNLLDQGWEVTASDYQGEGTPGPLPYLVGTIAARNTIDIVLAARHLPVAHASTNYVVWGHSEGGQTAMFALKIGPTYAPGLHLRGVVAGAPPSQFYDVYSFLKNSPYRYYLLMAAEGFHVAYGSKAPLNEVLTPKGVQALSLLTKGCDNYLAANVNKYRLSQVAKGNPFDVPAWRALLNANDPGTFTSASPVPLLIIQGGADEQIPVVSTQLLAQHLCSVGQTLQRWIYPGQSHSGVIAVSAPDMIHWISDRMAKDPTPDPYVPIGEPHVQTSECHG